MSIVEERLRYLEPLRLGRGGHEPPNNGLVHACVMEAVAYVANEPWSDHPECASPVIGQFLRTWNDRLDDDARQMLKPYITRLVGTKTSAEDEETRAWLATDWLARECAPAFMRLAGLTEQAELVEALAPITSTQTAKDAQPTLRAAQKASAAARDAAGDAAGAAAWAAAGAAAGAAARAALAPTVKELQASALLLLDRMIEVGKAS